jgi:transcriptional regulator with XRE-family HTH domain
MLTTTPPRTPRMAVSAEERAFHIDLGQRIAALRKQRGMTQVQLAEQLGNRIAERRKALGLTQAQLGELVDVTQQ